MNDAHRVLMHFINQLATPQSYTSSFVRGRYNSTWHPHADFYTVEYPSFTVRLEHSNYQRDDASTAQWCVTVHPLWSTACAEVLVYPNGQVVISIGTRDLIAKIIDYCLNYSRWSWWRQVRLTVSLYFK